jgi:uncharacterized protein
VRFNVAELLKNPIGATRSHEVSEAEVVVADDGSRSRVTGALTLLRTKSGILARATVRLQQPDACSRCVTPLEIPLELHIEEEYQPTVDIVTGAPRRRPEDSGTFLIDEHHVLDLTDAVHQYRMMGAPMQPLCQPDCAGLCPTCGQNLNEKACSCPSEEYDPRWSALAKLTQSDSEPS